MTPVEPPTIDAVPPPVPRSQARSFVGWLVITAATAQVLGLTIRMPSMLEANDISRWCTVWSLLERGSYAIDDCPWQGRTQDKVFRPDKLAAPEPGASALKRVEYALAPSSWKGEEGQERFYSSKPPLLPTMIAGLLYPFRVWSGVPLDRVVETPRGPRNVQKEIEGQPGKYEFVTETDRPPVKWPSYIYYFKPIIILFNVVPFFVTLLLFARMLDRHAEGDWAWFFGLFAAAWGTYLYAFDTTLNNHTVAAWSAFFALFAFLRAWDRANERAWPFALAGFFAAFCACNEIPAALFGILLFLVLLARSPRRTLLVFVPAALVPIIAFLVTQFVAFGQIMPVYEEFGTKSYEYEGSYWNTPLEMDYYNKEPEPWPTYLFHMTLGHHGIVSLTPIVLVSLIGVGRAIVGRLRGMRAIAWMTLLLTAALLAFYTWNPKARNYGGSTQGLRWLFWLFPFWLISLVPGAAPGEHRRWFRVFTLVCLAVSVFSVGFALRAPWSHPWVLDLMERLGALSLRR